MRIKDIVLLKEVAEDLQEGKNFYNKKEPGVGTYFLDSLIADIESLIIYAGIHIRKYGTYQMLSKRFPYAIYYDIKDEVAYVIAILPMRKDPGWIENKLKERD